jgi:hypothetical protein
LFINYLLAPFLLAFCRPLSPGSIAVVDSARETNEQVVTKEAHHVQPSTVVQWLAENRPILCIDTRVPQDFAEKYLRGSFNIFVPPILQKRWKKASEKESGANNKLINLETLVFPESERNRFFGVLQSTQVILLIDANFADQGGPGSVTGTIANKLLGKSNRQVFFLEGGFVALEQEKGASEYLVSPECVPQLQTGSNESGFQDNQEFKRTTSFALKTNNLRQTISSRSKPKILPMKEEISNDQSRVVVEESHCAFPEDAVMHEAGPPSNNTSNSNMDLSSPWSEDSLSPADLGPSEILKWLYLGPDLFAANPSQALIQLKQLNIQAVLSMAAESIAPVPSALLSIGCTEYLHIKTQDSADERIEVTLPTALQYIGTNIRFHYSIFN